MSATLEVRMFEGLCVAKERLSAKRLLSMSAAQRSNIRDIRFEAPRIGVKGFGEFVVRYKRPTYLVR